MSRGSCIMLPSPRRCRRWHWAAAAATAGGLHNRLLMPPALRLATTAAATAAPRCSASIVPLSDFGLCIGLKGYSKWGVIYQMDIWMRCDVYHIYRAVADDGWICGPCDFDWELGACLIEALCLCASIGSRPFKCTYNTCLRGTHPDSNSSHCTHIQTRRIGRHVSATRRCTE
jgi:hypothetical protein